MSAGVDYNDVGASLKMANLVGAKPFPNGQPSPVAQLFVLAKAKKIFCSSIPVN